MIDQNAPHQLGGNSKEAGFVLPSDFALFRQLEKSLMDKRCGLQRMVGSFPSHVVIRQSTQFPVDYGDQPVLRTSIPVIQILEQLSYVR